MQYMGLFWLIQLLYVLKNYHFKLKITMCKNKTKFLTYNAKRMKIRNGTFISDTVLNKSLLSYSYSTNLSLLSCPCILQIPQSFDCLLPIAIIIHDYDHTFPYIVYMSYKHADSCKGSLHGWIGRQIVLVIIVCMWLYASAHCCRCAAYILATPFLVCMLKGIKIIPLIHRRT